jgi:hypothetical protein
VFRATRYFFLAVFALYLGSRSLALSPKAAAFADRFCFLAFTLEVAL